MLCRLTATFRWNEVGVTVLSSEGAVVVSVLSVLPEATAADDGLGDDIVCAASDTVVVWLRSWSSRYFCMGG